MKDRKRAIIEKKGNRYLGFIALFSWDFHIDSWLNYRNFPILVIRYEDLQSETFQTLKKVISFIKDISKSKKNFDRSKAKETIKSCEFEKLKKMEEKNYEKNDKKREKMAGKIGKTCQKHGEKVANEIDKQIGEQMANKWQKRHKWHNGKIMGK